MKNYETQTTPAKKALKGLTACLSKNLITGPAYVLLDFARVQDFPDNHILVTEQTSPECTAAIEKAIAVITERGGILCHAAIVCRDLDIPCIVGVANLLENVATGTNITLDTQTGQIFF